MFDSLAPGRIDAGPLAGAWKLSLTVAAVLPLTPTMRTIRLTAPELATFEYEAGQDFMLAVPTEGGGTINRRYTIRRVDRDALTVDLEVVVHGEGPGARWAMSAQVGDAITAIGPRGKVVAARDAHWHLFAADESGVPATLAMLEALPHGTQAVALLAVADDREVRAHGFDDAVDLRWLVRGGVPAQQSGLLVDAVRALELPLGRGHAYLAAELSVVNAVRDALRDRGFADDQLAPKAYWRADQANAQHGEPARQ